MWPPLVARGPLIGSRTFLLWFAPEGARAAIALSAILFIILYLFLLPREAGSFLLFALPLPLFTFILPLMSTYQRVVKAFAHKGTATYLKRKEYKH